MLSCSVRSACLVCICRHTVPDGLFPPFPLHLLLGKEPGRWPAFGIRMLTRFSVICRAHGETAMTAGMGIRQRMGRLPGLGRDVSLQPDYPGPPLIKTGVHGSGFPKSAVSRDTFAGPSKYIASLVGRLWTGTIAGLPPALGQVLFKQLLRREIGALPTCSTSRWESSLDL